MFSPWYEPFDNDEEDFFSKPRKYTNSLPHRRTHPKFGYQLKRGNEEEQESLDAQDKSLTSRHHHLPEFWNRKFPYEMWDHPYKFWSNWDRSKPGQYFLGFDDSLHSVEKNDKYLVKFEEKGLDEDNVKIDFNEERNELLINVNLDESTDTSSSFKNYQSTIKFNKPININEIEAEVDENGVEMILPKTHADDENYHHVEIKRKAGDVQSL
ncbi:uncharacterized protein KGF55_001953 [Candida pseudojiufengensis]|uniref:uncharacterized protein n=1 Tax=Candida pseudojiufengensis TaxID=497109 RepID=UPI002224848C|nr:uncharacterized protein KGF55_001953 [Candida pseudojiufengensis]KAI5964882.1 hypothetical protein KGF55_001953 [Candida pseudojiufengensis]